MDSGQSVHVPYAGPALAAHTAYHWRVRTWDAHGRPSRFSPPASWEMGPLAPSDWSARWIASTRTTDEEKPSLGPWIWHREQPEQKHTVYFRTTVDVRGEVARAAVRITVDDRFVLYINGREVGRHDQWKNIMRFRRGPVPPGRRKRDRRRGRQRTQAGAACPLACALTTPMGAPSKWARRMIGASRRPRRGDWTGSEYDDSGWKVPRKSSRSAKDPGNSTPISPNASAKNSTWTAKWPGLDFT